MDLIGDWNQLVICQLLYILCRDMTSDMVYRLLLTKEQKPYWFSPEKYPSVPLLSPVTESSYSTLSRLDTESHDLRNLCCTFVHFFNDLEQVQGIFSTESGILEIDRYSNIVSALLIIKSFARSSMPITAQKVSAQPTPAHTYIDELLQLATLFYIAASLKDYLLSPLGNRGELEKLDAALGSRGDNIETWWRDPFADLYMSAISDKGFALINPSRSALVIDLMDVARLLDLEQWMQIKERLCDILLGNSIESSIYSSWNENMLYKHLSER